MSTTNTISSISAFLAERRIAIIGVSRNPQHFSRALCREFLQRGYDIVSVNPALAEVEGRRCFASVRDIDPPVRAALVVTPAAATETVVHECLAAGIQNIWLHRSGGQGSVTPAAVALCREQRVNVVAGECPLMFLSNAAFFHRAHGFIKKILGSYPANA